jgi:hypothetical protein
MPEPVQLNQQVIIPPGKPRLLHLDATPKEIVVQSSVLRMKSVQRHFNPLTHRTEVCKCDPLCPSSRLDTFASVLEWIGPLVWEQKMWSITEGALAYLFRLAILKRQSKEIGGMRLSVRRQGQSDNSRVVVDYLGDVLLKSNGFDVGYAVQKITGISIEFFQGIATEPEVPNADQVVTPIRARLSQSLDAREALRNGKPRVDKGKAQKK